MRLSTYSAKLFEKAIARAKRRGMTHYAKAVCSPTMRFGATLEEAERKAGRDARAMARAAGCPAMCPRVQSGDLA